MMLENFIQVADALHVPLSFVVYEQSSLIPETEQIYNILGGRNKTQKEDLHHMLMEMSEGMDTLTA